MYFDGHVPPHFHAEYAQDEVVVSVETLGVIAGRLQPRALGLVAQWAALHQEDLRKAWQKAKNMEATEKIAPLHNGFGKVQKLRGIARRLLVQVDGAIRCDDGMSMETRARRQSVRVRAP